MYRLIITGSRPEKGQNNRYLPVPTENVNFINEVLAKVSPSNVATIYHGAAKGVDSVADDYAFNNHIRVKQFPAYWSQWDDTLKKYTTDASQGHKRNREMINAAISDAYNTKDEIIVLAFHNKPLSESKGTAGCVEYAKKKNLTVRTFALPIQILTPQTVFDNV